MTHNHFNVSSRTYRRILKNSPVPVTTVALASVLTIPPSLFARQKVLPELEYPRFSFLLNMKRKTDIDPRLKDCEKEIHLAPYGGMI